MTQEEYNRLSTPMTQEEYNRLDYDFAHCAGTHCEQAGKCLRHTAYKMLAGNRNETYTMVNPAVIKGVQPGPFFEPDRKERFAWGISSIYNNVMDADFQDYQDMERANRDKVIRRTKLRDIYGNTYWYYYQYGQTDR